MNSKDLAKLLVIGSAVAGLSAGTSLNAATSNTNVRNISISTGAMVQNADAAKASDKHACKGMNGCSGKGNCKTGDKGCSGKNSCKGKGGCASKEAKHACHGQNACKNLGGCKTGDGGCAGKNSCKTKGGCKVPVDPSHNG